MEKYKSRNCSERQMELLRTAIIAKKDIVLFGTGMMGELVRRYLFLNSRDIALTIDNNRELWKKRMHGVRVTAPKAGTKKYPNAIYIIANIEHSEDMVRQLLRLRLGEKNIIVCKDPAALKNEIMRNLNVKRENQYFIFDQPYEQTLERYLSAAKSKMKAFLYRGFMNVWHPANTGKRRYHVSLCAIFKDEALYLREWIEYHKLVGVDHFYLYNNFSSDHFRKVIKPYTEAGEVSLIDWPYEQGQMSAYKDCVRRYKTESRWIGFLDLDEFVVPLKDDTIGDFLKRFEKNRGSVMIYWKLFGSAGRETRDTKGLVTEDFTVSWNKHADIGKCFFNTAYEFIPQYTKNGMLHHAMWTGCRGKALPPVNCFDRVCLEGVHPARGQFPIQINHYFTKSVDEYAAKKQKGDVYHKINPHDDQYFLWHEIKCGAVDVSAYKYLISLKKAMFHEK